MKYRPLRLVCMVDKLQNLSDAVRFNMHTWGGLGNLIIPTPKTERDVHQCRELIERFHPDAIIYDDDSVASEGKHLIDSLPVVPLNFGSHKAINGFITGELLFRITDTYVPNILHAHPDYQALSSEVTQAVTDHPIIKLVAEWAESSRSNPTAEVKSLPNHDLKEGLQYASGNKLEMFMKDLSVSWSMSDLVVDGYDFAYLYLTSGQQYDLLVLSAFWNDSIATTKNKIIVEKEFAIRNAQHFIEALRRCCPHFKYLRVVMSASEEEASAFRDVFLDVGNKLTEPFEVDVIYRDYVYATGQHKLIYGKEVYETVKSDGFDLPIPFPIPEWTRGGMSAFAVDVGIRENGRQFALPYTRTSAAILSYGPTLIKRFDFDAKHAARFGQSTAINPSEDGISFITSDMRHKEGQRHTVECAIPMGDDVVECYLGLRGYKFHANIASQYARVLVQRLDLKGMANKYFDELDVLAFLLGGKNSILRRSYKQLEAAIGRQRKAKVDRDELRKQISNLIHLGMLKRGNEIQCPRCKLHEWYAIEGSGEFVSCIGCEERILVPLNNEFHYKLTDMAVRLLTTGGRAVAQAVNVFRGNYLGNVTEVGGDVSKNDIRCDVDVFRFTSNEFAVVECKDRLDQFDETEMLTAAEKLIVDAVYLGADAAYLFVATNAVLPESIYDAMILLYEKAKQQSLQFNLMVNADIYILESKKLKLYAFESVQYYSNVERPAVLGSYWRDHGHRDFNGYFDHAAIEAL